MSNKYGYSFSEDELMQAIGNTLFPDEASIAISKNMKGYTVLSFLMYDETIYLSYPQANTPRNSRIIIYPVFDNINDYYNIVILITTYSQYDNRSYETVLEGDRPYDQNVFLEAIIDEQTPKDKNSKDKTIKEIWVKDRNKGFVSCVCPVNNIDVTRIDLLKKIMKWNTMEIKTCVRCNKEISKFSNYDLCSDCLSKENVEDNHKSIINKIIL